MLRHALNRIFVGSIPFSRSPLYAQ